MTNEVNERLARIEEKLDSLLTMPARISTLERFNARILGFVAAIAGLPIISGIIYLLHYAGEKINRML